MAKVLLVEDDVELAKTVADMLLFEKYAVEVVHTGTAGWERAQSDQFDLLILDWELPDLNGINILSRFRQAGHTAPVILLTGRRSVSDKELGLDCGADDYLTKPFAMEELFARIRAVLRRTEPQAPVYKALGIHNEDVLERAHLAGTLLASRYEFLEVLGAGGLGIVFKARQPVIEKLVAIKMLRSGLLHADTIERFKREGKFVSRLDHHNIANVYDFGVTERGQPFMVMEYVAGRNLGDMIREKGSIPIESGLDICIQICDGMAHAHGNGVLHRDIKPANILLKSYEDREPVVKILDFGLAKWKDPVANSAPDLTQQGQVFGSPTYMSPEQAKGEALDERSDIYSVGCVLYEMLSGVPPHVAETSMDIMLMHVTAEVTPLRERRPDLELPDSLTQLISKTLNKNPEQRYQSMGALREDLTRMLWNLRASASRP